MANSSFSKSEGAPFNFSYPEEWSDRDRMGYLLAPFPPATKPLPANNPKISFWSSLIMSSSRELQSLVVSEKDLLERFKWNGHTSPKCLDLVLEEMERLGHLMKVSDFSKGAEGWMWWSVGMLHRPVSWAVKSYLLPVAKYKGDYVIKSLVEVRGTVMIITCQQRSL